MYAIIDWHMLDPGRPELQPEPRQDVLHRGRAAQRRQEQRALRGRQRAQRVSAGPASRTTPSRSSRSSGRTTRTRSILRRHPRLVLAGHLRRLRRDRDHQQPGQRDQHHVHVPLLRRVARGRATWTRVPGGRPAPDVRHRVRHPDLHRDGGNNFTRSQQYLDLMAQKKISWTNWNYSDDERSGAVFKTGTCPRDVRRHQRAEAGRGLGPRPSPHAGRLPFVLTS